ncbi:hypothetical protein [Ostreibacterium oceani]|uniref:Uncharacterized protein n=1 Tax=Ostreibacterium oceani TaxID=2654998 RepID=A0A6N7EZ06_9GAMM|nr:hypothetical protein [Ostreibacterium oceani]MPV85718.1 hypothetical protein [Ostreibacterium oceani]
MNKKLISAAVLLGMSGAATAVHVNPDGKGQVLLYPYYTVNGGKDTYFHVVNTTNEYKAVKVRINEGVNTWEALDFNLYLSPYDVWAGGLTMGEDGVPELYTPDTSCTAPAINGRVDLRTFNIDSYAQDQEPAAFDDIDPVERLAEGHIEMIEMGIIEDDADPATAALIKTYIKHVNGVPGDCEALVDLFRSGPWATNEAQFLHAPTGGLFGTAEIIDVANGIDRGYSATAIADFWDLDAATDATNAHTFPGTSYPNLNGQTVQAGTLLVMGSVDADIAYTDAAGAQAVVNDAGLGSTVEALSAALSVASLSNQFYVADSVNGATDWVVTFPTKHFFVNGDSTAADFKSGQFGLDPTPGPLEADVFNGLAPFDNGFAVDIEMSLYDREEETVTADIDFSPSGTNTGRMLFEVNVLEFAADRSVLDSTLASQINVPAGWQAGWAQLDFSAQQVTGATLAGMPAIGFAAQAAQNGTLGGGSTLANYAALFDHVYGKALP